MDGKRKNAGVVNVVPSGENSTMTAMLREGVQTAVGLIVQDSPSTESGT